MRAFPLILPLLALLGLGLLAMEERGAPRIRVGPLTFGPALGVDAGTGVPAPVGSKDPELASTRVALPHPPDAATPVLQGEGPRGTWVHDPSGRAPRNSSGEDSHLRHGMLRMILLPEVSAGGGSRADLQVAPSVEMIERLLELEASLDRRRPRDLERRIS